MKEIDTMQALAGNPDLCFSYFDAINTRIRERRQGKDDSGTMGQEEMGCYDCDGLKKNCPSYISKNSLEELSQ